MRQVSLITISVLLLLSSCTKDHGLLTDPMIQGRWKMVVVVDNSSGSIETKPAIFTGDVEMELKYTVSNQKTGALSGKTITNVFDGTYSTTANHLFTATIFGVSQVMETDWGNLFLQNNPSSVNFFFDTQERLNIKTTVKTLLFEKI